MRLSCSRAGQLYLNVVSCEQTTEQGFQWHWLCPCAFLCSGESTKPQVSPTDYLIRFCLLPSHRLPRKCVTTATEYNSLSQAQATKSSQFSPEDVEGTEWGLIKEASKVESTRASSIWRWPLAVLMTTYLNCHIALRRLLYSPFLFLKFQVWKLYLILQRNFFSKDFK